MKRLTEVRKAQMVTGELTFFSVYIPESIIPTVTKEEDEELYYIQSKHWENIVNSIRIIANPVLIGTLEPYGFSFAIEQYGHGLARMFETTIHRQGILSFSKDNSITRDLTKVRVQEQESFNLASEFYIINSGNGVGLYKTNEEGDPILRSIEGKDGIDVNYSEDDSSVEISGRFVRNDVLQELPVYSQPVNQASEPHFDSNKFNTFTYAIQGNGETLTLETPSDSNARTITVFLKNGASYPPSYGDNIHWLGGEEPELGNDDIVTFVTVNGGDLWYGSHVGSIDEV